MKNTLALLGMGLAAILFSSGAFAQETPESKETKETRHIKMTKIENGKKMELDTVLTGNDVFVWNGDTINPEKHAHFGSSGIGKMPHFYGKVGHKGRKGNVMFYKQHGGKAGGPMSWNMDSDENIQVFSDEVGDSIQKRIIIRKGFKDGNEEVRQMYMNAPNMKHFQPMPPMPPVPPHFKMIKRQHPGRVIDLNDPNIISYKKKSMSGDREKIEIVRKKSEEPENMNFDFEIDDEIMAPEPPVFMKKFNRDDTEPKIIRKEIRIEDKNDKKIEEEVKPKENK